MGQVSQDIVVDKEVGPWIGFAILAFFNVLVILINERNWFICCCRGCNKGGLLCITNRASRSPRDERPNHFLVWDLLDSTHLAKGERCGPLVVLLFRLLCLAVFVFQILWQAFAPDELTNRFDDEFLQKFTNWSFVVFGFNSLVGMFISWRTLRRDRKSEWGHSEQAVQPYGFLDKTYHFVYMACTPASVSLSVFYWVLLYKGGAVTLDDIIKHGASAVLLLADLLVSRTPIVSYHVAIPIWYTTAYTVFMWIWYDITAEWQYNALDWSKLSSGINYVAMVALLMLSTLLMYLLAGLREYLITGTCSSCCTCRGKKESQFKTDAEYGYRAEYSDNLGYNQAPPHSTMAMNK